MPWVSSDVASPRKKAQEETPEEREKRIQAKNERIRNRNKLLQDRTAQRWRAKKPEVGRVDLQNFKNRYNWTPEYREYAVEALIGPWDLYKEFRTEKSRRDSGDRVPESLTRTDVVADLLAERVMAAMRTSSGKDKFTTSPDMDMNETYIHRVRVNSLPVLGYLAEYMGTTVRRTVPRTFMRPFRTLIHSLPFMKQVLAELENRFGCVKIDDSQHEGATDSTLPTAHRPDMAQVDAAKSVYVPLHQNLQGQDGGILSLENGEHQTGATEDMIGKAEADGNPEANDETASVYTTELQSVASDDTGEYTTKLQQLMDSHEALQDMRCYVNFIEQNVLPHFNDLRGNQVEKVIFDDLWCLFRPGDLLYLHNKDIPGDHEEESWEEDLWRLYRVAIPNFVNDYSHVGGEDDEQGRRRRGEQITLYCYRIGHDGLSYGAIRMKIEMPYFPGRRPIRSMSMYPLRFAKNSEEILQAARIRGQRFHNAYTNRHQLYQNWTLEANLRTSPEFIEGNVIVDLEETFKKDPERRPKFHHPTIDKDGSFDEDVDEWDILYWKNDLEASTSSYFSVSDYIQQDHKVQLRQRRELFETDTFWRRQSKPSRFDTDGTPNQAMALRDEDLILLPRRSFAYTLRERKFVAIDVNYLRPVPVDNGLFDSLQIIPDYKKIIRGLVSSHFQKKELDRLYASQSIEGFDQDLIRGKGKGLVLLLHGAPGVGKTATAEAVAMENSKPLFTITCGDLGVTPSDVEIHLSEIFRLAGKWGCVLLLDEADVFLSQRSQVDLKRNALVSVFLRVLEYYSGLLFLTTNRVGTIDEAFKSRIHMSLSYPPLDKQKTIEIFRVNIKKLQQMEEQRSALTNQPRLIIHEDDIMRFAEQHFDGNINAKDCWNGRQIRNSFQIASSLALYHYELEVKKARANNQEPPRTPELDSGFFETVQKATRAFNIYMKETKGWSDQDLAHRHGWRSDYLEGTQFVVANVAQQPQPGTWVQATNAAGIGHHIYPGSPSPAPGMVFIGQQASSMRAAAVHNQHGPDSQAFHTPERQHGSAMHLGGPQSLNFGVSPSPTARGQIYQQVPHAAAAAHMQQHDNGLSPSYASPKTPQQASSLLGSPHETLGGSGTSSMGGQPGGYEQVVYTAQSNGLYAGPGQARGTQASFQTSQTSSEDVYR